MDKDTEAFVKDFLEMLKDINHTLQKYNEIVESLTARMLILETEWESMKDGFEGETHGEV